MIIYKPGDIILLDFGFSEGIGMKKRPAVIISSSLYNETRQEVIVTAITSNLQRILIGDTEISEWKQAKLLYPSVVTAIIRTVKKTLILNKLGNLSSKDLQKVKKSLKEILF